MHTPTQLVGRKEVLHLLHLQLSDDLNQINSELNKISTIELKNTSIFSLHVYFLSYLSGSERDKFMLLCPDGTQAPISHYRSCNLGRGPGAGMVTRHNFRKVARKFLIAVQVQ